MADATETQAPQAPAPDASAVEVHDPVLAQVVDQAGPTGGGQIDLLLDATMPVTVQLGQVDLPVRTLMQMGPGSVITMPKQVGEPLDLCLKGVRFATGYLVVVGNQMGVRIKEVVSENAKP